MRERCEGLALRYNDERVAMDTSEACRAFRLMSTGGSTGSYWAMAGKRTTTFGASE